MVYVSICFYHLWFLSSVSYSFLSTGLPTGLFWVQVFYRFIPRYFILFFTMVNGIVSLISLSDLSLLVYRDARGFCALILYPETLPNSLISSCSFLVALLGFSMYSIMSSADSDSFTSSFPICIPFSFVFLFLLWLPWLGLPKLCWIQVARVDILVLFLILVEMLSVFHH